MLFSEDYFFYLTDPIFVLVAAVVVSVAYYFSSVRSRRLRKKRAALRVRANRAETPRERRELMLQWSELGGLRERQRAIRRRSAREEGQVARADDRPLSANPHPHSLWGHGRQWRLGWRSVDRQIRWIESQR